MLWGNSPPVDLSSEVRRSDENAPLEILIVGACDARHVIKTLSRLRVSSRRAVNFYCFETNLEDIARSILLVNICLEEKLGFQEACRYFLEVLGNTLITPGTSKYLIRTLKRLIDVITQTSPCPWLSIHELKYKDRDSIEAIFKFWIRALCEGIPIVEYWDNRVRKSLKTRYDYRDGVFDWDYHMVLKSMGLKYLTIHEYKFWRSNGIAFNWIETEPSRCNPTLLSDVHAVGQGFVHFAYRGDIKNGPFFTWALDNLSRDPKLRATDIAEGQVLKAIYQIRKSEVCPEEFIAAHRNESLIAGTLVTHMPDTDIELESWDWLDYSRKTEESSWADIENISIKFYPTWYVEKCTVKVEFHEKFDVAFIANNVTDQIPNLAPWMKKNANILVETRKFTTELVKKDQDGFVESLKKLIEDSGLRELLSIDQNLENILRYVKE